MGGGRKNVGMEEQHLIADIPQKAIIEHDGKVLIVQDDKGKWQLPGGRLNEGEEPRAGLRREIKEELDVDVEPAGIFDTFIFTSASGQYHFVMVYICRLISKVENIKQMNAETTDLKWISSMAELENLQENTVMWEEYKEVLQKFFKERMRAHE